MMKRMSNHFWEEPGAKWWQSTWRSSSSLRRNRTTKWLDACSSTKTGVFFKVSKCPAGLVVSIRVFFLDCDLSMRRRNRQLVSRPTIIPGYHLAHTPRFEFFGERCRFNRLSESQTHKSSPHLFRRPTGFLSLLVQWYRAVTVSEGWLTVAKWPCHFQCTVGCSRSMMSCDVRYTFLFRNFI